MWLSDVSVKRPVFAAVINLLIIAFGILAFSRLALREYPDIDPPVVSVDTTYPGAAASVVETRITQVLEDRISGIEGIKSISSQSQDGRSRITIEFDISRDIDDAANDIRDRVSGSVDDLPVEADPPDIQKADSDDEVILWLNLTGEGMDIMQLTDYARRYVEDRFSSISGVARVRVGGGQEQAMRIWLKPDALAARGLTADDVEQALRVENVELPAGTLESAQRDFTLRVQRSYLTPDDFRKLVVARGADGYLVRLGDVARVELAPVEERSTLRGNGLPMVGIGIIKQSKANILDVARAAKEEAAEANKTLPPHMAIKQSYDSSIFVEEAVKEVYVTLAIAVVLVTLVIYAFLGNIRATIVPAVTVPVSLIGTFIILFMLGYSLNLLTLLALVLAIGLVVDDAIVVIENIHRRVELGEPRLLAAYRGARQVGFAVVATTIVLIAVFLPITFLEGDIGRLFREFAVAMAAAVGFSAFVALTFSPMLASKLIAEKESESRLSRWLDARFERIDHGYQRVLSRALGAPLFAVVILLAALVGTGVLFSVLPREFAPQEDRGTFNITIRGPEGASFDYIMQYVDIIEQRLTPYTESGEVQRLLMRAPGSFGTTESFNDARGVVVMSDWGERKPIWFYLDKVRELTKDLSGVQVFSTVRQAFRTGSNKPVQFVLGGPSYEELAKWRDLLMAKASENKNLIGLDYDYKETKPQIGVTINRDRAASLGIPVETIGRTLETMLGSRRVTTYIDRGEEYDVMLESEKALKRTPLDIQNLYVRSAQTGALVPLSNLVTLTEFADSTSLNRYNRVRAITLEANLERGYSLSEALDYLEGLVRTELPPGATIDYKGESQDFKESGSSIYLIFALALVVVFLVLAGQFESFVHPLIIMLTVPLAIVGALLALYITGLSLNIYSQISLIMLVGIAAKNGILIVEFINQLRDEGVEFSAAILDASMKRLRPILMTSLTTVMGAVPLVISGGAGAESRSVIGTVVIAGVLVTTLFTLFVVPVMYRLLAKHTGSPEETAHRLQAIDKEHKEQV